MTATIAIVAFADDVRCLNANLGDIKLTRIAAQFGLVEAIGAPTSAKPLLPRTDLHAHEATFTTQGRDKLAEASRTEAHAKQLRLSDGETFGLLLAHWRDYYGSICDGMSEKPHGPQFCKLARYKISRAEVAGDAREANRLAKVLAAMKKEFDDERRRDRQLERSLAQYFGRACRR